MVTLLEVKSKLEAEGLYVSYNDPNSLWIAANVRDVGEGIMLSNDACSVREKEGKWVAIFPTAYLLTYEVPGTLAELVTLISTVYRHYRQEGSPFTDAWRQVMSEADQYLIGRPLTRV